MNISTKYTYDKAGNKFAMTDGRGKITRYESGKNGTRIKYIKNGIAIVQR